jgi:hypothetical protein
MAPPDDLDDALRAVADHAREIEPRIEGVSFRRGDARMVMLLTMQPDQPREVTHRLYRRLQEYREAEHVECDVLIVNGTTPAFASRPQIPDALPPDVG